MNLEKIQWKQLVGEAMMVMVPREKHGELECREAKKVELQKLED